MSEKKTGGQAFPRSYAFMNPEAGKSELKSVEGLTIRDYFAGQALIGMVTADPDGKRGDEKLAQWSYMIADALLAEREKP